MAQVLQHQRVVLDKFSSGWSTVEMRVEGISMPTYHGHVGDPLQVFLQQVKLYFSAKNIDVQESTNQGRLIAMAAANLKGQAAAWFTFNQDQFTNLNELADARQAEFIPPDLQERLNCRRKNLCFRCKKLGHRMNYCHVKSSRGRRKDGPRRVVNSVRIRTPSLDESKMDESMSLRNYTMNMARLESQASMELENRLIRKKVLVNGRERIALIDCSANHNLIRPGIVDDPGTEHVASLERFDGHIRRNMRLRAVHATVEMDVRMFDSISLTEYRLPVTHDLILAKPWMTRFIPAIDWQTHVITVSSMKVLDTMDDRLKDCDLPWDGNSDNHLATQAIQYYLYHVNVTAINDQKDESPEVSRLLDEYRDVFPDELPVGLPPERCVEFELNMKPDARPSTRAPFRLSKTEQDAIQLFVEDLLSKEWTEISDSPWVSNVFGAPKRDPRTGKMQSRAEWIRSGDPTSPIRWVVDYRYLNIQTLIPKIPLPNIEQLFNQMAHARVFSVIDLAQGYHQMRVKPATRPYTAFRTGVRHTDGAWHPWVWLVCPVFGPGS
ncbi:hypothetical protein PsorP6_015880 [Peronosclerospora sorghi]|uniref:Uncharacterized protein n=1 Tax=Peronosclerospora sorghi TaxID=230839 RepID=A0ACC0WPQ3_9STRA|nr:hypothetical protein PsorP6_015880 [Peronosclerospora sorghi]